MNRRDIVHRLAGVVALLGAGAASLLHRGIWLAHSSGSAVGGGALFGFLAFVLACLGALLLIRGSKNRDHKRRARGVRRDPGSGDDRSGMSPEKRWIEKAERNPAAFANGRVTLAAFLVMRARQAAAHAQPSDRIISTKHEPGASG